MVYYGPSIHYITNCNILNNEQYDDYGGLIDSSVDMIIENCSIYGNKGPPGLVLFANHGCDFLVKNCNVQSSPTIIPGITTENIKYEESYINLSELSALNCGNRKFPVKIDETLLDIYSNHIKSFFAHLSLTNKRVSS